MESFIYEYPTKVLFGKGAVKEQLAKVLKPYGNKILLALPLPLKNTLKGTTVRHIRLSLKGRTFCTRYKSASLLSDYPTTMKPILLIFHKGGFDIENKQNSSNSRSVEVNTVFLSTIYKERAKRITRYAKPRSNVRNDPAIMPFLKKKWAHTLSRIYV